MTETSPVEAVKPKYVVAESGPHIRTATIEVVELHCQKCHAVWHMKGKKLPEVCLKCKSRKWDMPRKRKESNGSTVEA